MFTMASVEDHRARKRMLARPYAKTNVVSGWVATVVEGRVSKFVEALGRQGQRECEIGKLLGWCSLDVATAFVFGRRQGTDALSGIEEDAALLEDYQVTDRRKLSWLGVHGGSNVKVAVVRALGWLPKQREDVQPFSRIRGFAKDAFKRAKYEVGENAGDELSLLRQLKSANINAEQPLLQDIDIVSECADHLLAGIETTRNLLLFLIWVLSLPANGDCQRRLRDEVVSLKGADLNDQGHPTVEGADKLPYLNAVLKEALRLYAPLPASQPRFFKEDIVIDGYLIPSGTVDSMSPYCLHRNTEVFPRPLEFLPERWLKDETAEMRSSWWPFSSGGRMCTGMQ
jgi:cytochrome P450